MRVATALIAPTVWTIMFLIFAGLHGFMKFSHEAKVMEHYDNPTTSVVPAHPPFAWKNDSFRSHDVNHPLITYVYSESAVARENLIYFLENGLHGEADFVFILNGQTTVGHYIPPLSNVKVVSRRHECFALGAHGEVLRENNLWKRYNRFITLNSDIRGPFVPYWSRTCWSEIFLRRITEDVKLVGMSAQCLPMPYIESMIWATDSVGMELLLYPSCKHGYCGPRKIVAFGDCNENHGRATRLEYQYTSVVKNAGYKVDALTAEFHKSETYEKHCQGHPVDHIQWNKNYFGVNNHPYETIFMKADRYADREILAQIEDLHVSRFLNGSWDVCRRSV